MRWHSWMPGTHRAQTHPLCGAGALRCALRRHRRHEDPRGDSTECHPQEDTGSRGDPVSHPTAPGGGAHNAGGRGCVSPPQPPQWSHPHKEDSGHPTSGPLGGDVTPGDNDTMPPLPPPALSLCHGGVPPPKKNNPYLSPSDDVPHFRSPLGRGTRGTPPGDRIARGGGGRTYGTPPKLPLVSGTAPSLNVTTGTWGGRGVYFLGGGIDCGLGSHTKGVCFGGVHTG